jgi:hypothetical protein
MAKYTFVKDYSYTVYGIGRQDNTIKKGQSFDGIETANGIVISPNGSDLSNYQKEVLYPDMPSSYLEVPKEYLTQSFFQQHKNHLLILGGLVLGYLAFKKFNK